MKKTLTSLFIFALAGFLLSTGITVVENAAHNIQQVWSSNPDTGSVLAYK